MTPPQPCPLPHPPISPPPSRTWPEPWPTAPRSVDLVTQRHPRAVPQTRAHLREVLHAWHIPASLIEDAALLATELATNAVLHGTGPTLRIHTRCHQHILRCQIHDNGPRANAEPPASRDPESTTEPTGELTTATIVTAAPPEPNPANPLTETGRGLALVDALATRWGTTTDPLLTSGTHVAWFEITYPEADPALLHRVLAGLHRL